MTPATFTMLLRYALVALLFTAVGASAALVLGLWWDGSEEDEDDE